MIHEDPENFDTWHILQMGNYYFGKQTVELPVLVIPRLDRGIQSFHYVLDCPVKPDNDDLKIFDCRGINNSDDIVYNIYMIALALKTLKQMRRLVIGIIGTAVLFAGIAMIVLPGPAVVVIPIGLGILATEFVWAKSLLSSVKQRIEKNRKKKENPSQS